MDKLQLIGSLMETCENLSFDDKPAVDAFEKRTTMLLRKIAGMSSQQYMEFQSVTFYYSSLPRNEQIIYFDKARSESINIFTTLIEEITLFNDENNAQKTTMSNRIFIVHGHNVEMKEAVARVLTTLELDPIILHEQATKGRTIIEKLTDYADVQFAVVLLSPDDAFTIGDKIIYRARQNVILELGFFIGHIGRSNVMPLYKETSEFEIPNDYKGVVYVPYDEQGSWRLSLVKELKEAGYNVDANKLIDNNTN